MAKKDIIPSREQNDFIIYHSKDGKINVALMTRDGNVWLNQQQIATLFATSVPNISMHIANVLKEGELDAHSVIKNYLTTASDGKQANCATSSFSAATMKHVRRLRRCSLPRHRTNCFMQ